MSQYTDIVNLINKRFTFEPWDKMGKWKTAIEIACDIGIGIEDVTQAETRLINKAMQDILSSAPDDKRIRAGYKMYYVKGR